MEADTPKAQSTIAETSSEENIVVKANHEMPESEAGQISKVQANLPLPEQPHQASDWQSADARNVDVSAGGNEEAPIGTGDGAQAGLRGPATKGAGMDMSAIGRDDKKA